MKRTNTNKLREALDPYQIEQFKGLELKARAIVEGFISGLHKSPRHGFSVEFNQHKAYSPGDDIRGIDWRVYGRTDRYFIKQYEEETNTQVHLVVDASKSMDFRHSGSVSKFQYALTTAAALAYLLIGQRDAVGVSLISDRINAYLPPSAKEIQFNSIIQFLETARADGISDLQNGLNELSRRINRRSIVIIFSDLMVDTDPLVKSLELLRFKNNETVVIQILDKTELDLPFSNMVRFIDSETKKELTVDMGEVQETYKKNLQSFFTALQRYANSSGTDYHRITTEESFGKTLRNILQKRQGGQNESH